MYRGRLALAPKPAALVIELKPRLIDAALDMADRMIGGSFTRGSNAKQRVYAATKRIPKGIIAMVSALAFHGLTDQMPRKTCVAIAPGDWSPVTGFPPLRIVRFAPKYLTQGVEHYAIAGVDVPIFSVTNTLADLFRNSRLVDPSIAVEGLRAALELRKAARGYRGSSAARGGWRTMRPYPEALSFNG